MLDQNTDRMWYVIGAVIVGAALIFLMNTSFPQIFASVGDTMGSALSKISDNDNLIIESQVKSGWMNDEGIVSGGSVDGSLGTGDWASDFIDVEDAEYMTFTTNGRHQTKRAMFFDDLKEPVQPRMLNTEPNNTVMIYDVPAGAKYLRVSSMNWGTGHFKVERGKYSTGPPPVQDDVYFGKNLLTHSKKFTMDGSQSSGITRTITSEGHMQVKVSAKKGKNEWISDFGALASKDTIEEALTIDDMYTVSVQVKSSDLTILLATQHLAWTQAIDGSPQYSISGRIGSEWTTLSTPRGSWADAEYMPTLVFKDVEGTITFRNLKLEKGVAATPYE